VVDAQTVEYGLIQYLAAGVVGLAIQLLRLAEQLDGAQHQRPPTVEVGFRRFELAAQHGLLLPDRLQALAQLLLRPVRVADQIEVVVFRLIEDG